MYVFMRSEAPTAKPEQNMTFQRFLLLSTLARLPFPAAGTAPPGIGAASGSFTTRSSTAPRMATPVKAASRLGYALPVAKANVVPRPTAAPKKPIARGISSCRNTMPTIFARLW